MTHGEPLRNLPQLRVGDDVIVETRDATYTYRLINDGDSLEVTNLATWVLDPVPANPEGECSRPRTRARACSLLSPARRCSTPTTA